MILPSLRTLVVIAVWVAVIGAVIAGMGAGLHHYLDDLLMDPDGTVGVLLVVLVVLYTLLMALPFVPGLEVGVMLVLLRGAEFVPVVYLATVTGLLLAFLAGRQVPPATLARIFDTVRLGRAAALAREAAPLGPAGRVAMLQDRIPLRLGRSLLRWRHPILAAALNLPGNALIGGGGGICLLAGASRLVGPGAMVATITLGVAPAPLIIWLFGLPPFMA